MSEENTMNARNPMQTIPKTFALILAGLLAAWLPVTASGAEPPAGDLTLELGGNVAMKLAKIPRLPTEAEFEYATRAGTTTRYFYGDDPNYKQLSEYAWWAQNCNMDTHPVGQKKPNAWGLYDVYSNVWQWCSDWFGDYPSEKQTDPRGPATGQYRVLRGGCWLIGHHTMDDGQGRMLSRSALRGTPGYYEWDRPNAKDVGRIGFRVVVEER
ncbi:MAG: formylglycine-generating enzyme family protein [Planctomycetes bacterium]|nr:formylglycine-generating enzyme family protein [Planctomycetota bacterium]